MSKRPSNTPRQITWLEWAGYWGWGVTLFVGLLGVGFVLLRAALCVDPLQSTKDVIKFGNCADWVPRWYLILRDWQTGIGATIGLLGVAWSTFYKTATSRGSER